MDIRVKPRQIEPFRSPKRTLGDLDADSASRLITVGTDIALVIDAKGFVKDVACGSEDLARESCDNWIGQRWVDTVTEESREKISEILSEAGGKTMPRWRQINHNSPRGGEIPIRYTAVQIAENGRVVAVGRDLRAIGALQQKLVDAQQNMEREYARLRHAETRYRLLFQISSEAVLIVDSETQRVIEANPAAMQMIGRPSKKIVGRPFSEFFTDDSQKRLAAGLAAASATGKTEDARLKLAERKIEVSASGTLYRQEGATHVLMRLTPTLPAATALLKGRSSLMEVIEKLPDGFVVTNGDCRVLTANRAFLDLVQAATEEQVRDEPLGRWLGRQGVDMTVLTKNLKDRGEIRNFGTVVRGQFGSTENVEVSAVSVTGGEEPCLGFTIRNVSRRPETIFDGRRAMSRSVEQLTGLVGRVSLKELVRESTDMIERLCIEAALELTGDNRASAAEMLGLSRQGLYSKLRRHGLGDLGVDEAS